MIINKTCSCGKKWLHLPETARTQFSSDELAGHYFECDCGSTLFIPFEKESERAA